MTTAAIPRFIELIRVSSTQQSDRDTPEIQRRELLALREKRPGILVERIEDGAAGLSGALPMSERPDLLRMLKLAQARAFDEVRVFDLDRLTRSDNPAERLGIFVMLKQASAVIVDRHNHVTDPSDSSGMGELDFTLRSFFNAQEKRKILDRTVGGKRNNAKRNGKASGRTPYGYTYDKTTKVWGIHEEKAALVRKMYQMAAEGRTLAQITDKLNEEGHPAAMGGRWSRNYVYDILQHDRYLGKSIYSYGGESFTVQLPQIISVDLAEAARLAFSRRNHVPVKSKGVYRHNGLLRHAIRCGECGGSMTIEPQAARIIYRCRGLRFQRKGHHRALEVQATDEAVWQAVSSAIRDPLFVEKALGKRGKKSPEADWLAQAKACSSKLATLKQRERAILGVLSEGLALDGCKEQLRTIARQRETVERSKALAERQARALAHASDAVAVLEQERTRLLGALDSTDAAERQRVIQRFTPKDGPLVTAHADRLELHWIFLSDGPQPDQGGLCAQACLDKLIPLSFSLEMTLPLHRIRDVGLTGRLAEHH